MVHDIVRETVLVGARVRDLCWGSCRWRVGAAKAIAICRVQQSFRRAHARALWNTSTTRMLIYIRTLRRNYFKVKGRVAARTINRSLLGVLVRSPCEGILTGESRGAHGGCHPSRNPSTGWHRRR